MVGGRPPQGVSAELCTIADVFSKMSTIKNDPDCRAGCAGGTGICPDDWYPNSSDECSSACGAVFEPFVSPLLLHKRTALATRLIASLTLDAVSGTSAEKC